MFSSLYISILLTGIVIITGYFKEIKFIHKYVGNHALMVSSPKPRKEGYPKYDDISAQLTVFVGGTEVFTMENKRPGQLTGCVYYGAFPFWNKVLMYLHVSKKLNARAVVSNIGHHFILQRVLKKFLHLQKKSLIIGRKNGETSFFSLDWLFRCCSKAIWLSWAL